MQQVSFPPAILTNFTNGDEGDEVTTWDVLTYV